MLDRQGYPPKKDRALFWVPAWPVSAPDGWLRLPMVGSAGEGGPPGPWSPPEKPDGDPVPENQKQEPQVCQGARAPWHRLNRLLVIL